MAPCTESVSDVSLAISLVHSSTVQSVNYLLLAFGTMHVHKYPDWQHSVDPPTHITIQYTVEPLNADTFGTSE